MRHVGWILALVVTGGAAQPKGCDVKTTEKGKWCVACKDFVGEKDVEKGLHKGKGDDHKVEDGEACVKKYYEAPCHPDKRSAGPGKCCGNDMVEKASKARVVFRCEACGGAGKAGGACEKKGCKDNGKKLVKSCEKSGEPPHVATK